MIRQSSGGPTHRKIQGVRVEMRSKSAFASLSAKARMFVGLSLTGCMGSDGAGEAGLLYVWLGWCTWSYREMTMDSNGAPGLLLLGSSPERRRWLDRDVGGVMGDC